MNRSIHPRAHSGLRAEAADLLRTSAACLSLGLFGMALGASLLDPRPRAGRATATHTQENAP